MSKKFFVADTHCDTLGYVDEGRSNLINTYNTSKLYPHIQVYAMYCALEGESDADAYSRACRYIEHYKNCTRNEGIVRCTSVSDIDNAIDNNSKYMSLLSIEGCECLNGSLENLYRFYEAGVRILSPVWNNNNVFAAGCHSTGTEEDSGLTKKGVQLVELCEKLGIIIDISHSSDNTVKDIMSMITRPICASHSNFREICDNPRNLTLQQSLKIAEFGGYIGLNLYYKFVRDNISVDETSYYIDELLSHVKYANEIGIGDNIGFGFDIDGVGDIYPKDIDLKISIHDIFIEKLISFGLAYRWVQNISGKNFLDFITRYGL
ncbi:MAG: membrane dipeptidase [Clostridia bacterium]|nr:membrane dipeptidase [Clostridia bacterium]